MENTIYLFSAASNGLATLELAYPGTSRKEQMLTYYDDVVGAAGVMTTFLQYGFMALLKHNLNAEDQIALKEIQMSGRPTLESISFPSLALLRKRHPPVSGSNTAETISD